jgi:hypothetical protein
LTDRRFDWSKPAANPYDAVLADQDRQRAGGAITTAPGNPAGSARANVLARETGLPPDTVFRNLPSIEREQSDKRALRDVQSNPYMERWFGDPNNAAAAHDDTGPLKAISDQFHAFWNRAPVAHPVYRGASVGEQVWNWMRGAAPAKPTRVDAQARADAINDRSRNADGFLGRARALLSTGTASVEAGLYQSLGAIQGWLGDNAVTDAGRASFARTAGQNQAAARSLNNLAPVRGATTWEQVNGIRSAAKYGVEQGIASLPGMATVMAAPLAYVASNAGNIGQQRAQNNGEADATARDVLLATPAAIASAALERIGIEGMFGGFGNRLAQRIVGQGFARSAARVGVGAVASAAGEAATESAQSAVEYAGGAAGTARGVDVREALDQIAQGAVAGGFMGGAIGGVHAIGHQASGEARTYANGLQAQAGAQILDSLAGSAEASQLRQRDPEAFREFIAGQTDGTPIENIYIPAEAIRELNQDYHNDPFWADYADQIADALAVEGDVVIPTADAAARLIGTDAWGALRGEMRFMPGGMSEAEFASLERSHGEQLEMTQARLAEQIAEATAAAAPAAQVYTQVRDQLAGAGFAPDAADRYAQLWAANRETWGARLGTDALAYHEANPITFRRILPEALSRVQAADNMDLAINAMRRGGEAKENLGPSLLDWISKQGGIEDLGGDIAAMGGDRWHRDAKFRRKLIRPGGGMEDMLGGQQNANTPDELALRAWEAGYFPEMADRPDVNTLLNAIDDELRGTPRHAQEPEGSATNDIRAAAEELRRLVEARGLDPGTASAADIRAALELQQSEAEANADTRGLTQGVRGRALIGDNPGAIIDLFSGSDLSTVIHETGHVWLEELARNARIDVAPADVRADWQAVQDWFAANGHPVGGDGYIPTEAHELWARGWERYALEGKAPSSALRRAFDAFRGWMLSIYKHVANLRVNLTPEVREVFDRMLATDDAINDERQRQGVRALFTDAAQAGMTDAEFAAYQQAAGDARSEAFDALLYRTMATIRASRTKAWKEEHARVRDEVSAAVNAEPEFRALHLLRTGRWLGEPEREGVKVKLDRQWLIDNYGSDALASLPKGVPPIYVEGGMDADTVAEMVGFRNGDEMVRALLGVEIAQREMRAADDKRSVRDRIIADRTAEIMADRHGDPLSDGSIEEEALAAINNDRQGEVIASEVRQLAKRRGDVPTPYRLAREWAARKVSEGKVIDVASRAAMQRYARASAKAARGAETAILAGDVDEAFRQKQAQMLNQALLVEAKAAADQVDTIVDRLGKVARSATRKSVDQDYMDRAHALLEKFDFRGRTQRLLAEQESFATWAETQRANGIDVVIPPRLESEGVHYSRMSVEELRGLDASVTQVMHLGRMKQKLLDAKEERDFNEVVGEAIDAAGALRQRPPSDLMEASWGERFRAGVASADAALLKIEAVFDWLDGGNPNGVFNRVAFRPIAEAQDRENDMTAAYLGEFRELMAAVPKETLRSWSERVQIPELVNRDTGNPFTFSRQQLVAIALNMGNAGNVQRLTDGYGWSEAGVRGVLNRELTESEWKFVQGAWDMIGKLWPNIAALEKRVNGVEPEKVESIKVETPHGTFDGGYYPAVYDSTRDNVAERHAGESADLFSTMYTRANTAASATKARSDKVVRPILLDLGVITRHLTETIHDITHREAVMNADKFLSAPRVAAAVDASLGREIRQQFRPWLKFVANRYASERAGNEGLGKFINKARANVTVVGMGFRVSTIMSQLAGYSNSAEYVGPGWIAHGIGTFARAPVETFNFAMERSGELRHRMDTLDRDIGQQLRSLQGKPDPITAAKRFAFHGIGYMDRAVAVPTWIGAYAKAVKAGASEADAIYEGDKAIRLSQGAGSAKDLAAVQRGTGKHGELLKLMTMFYSYVSTVYQRERTLARDIGGRDERRPRDLPKLAARAFFLLVLPPVLAEILSGRGPEDDEDWGWWTFEKMTAQALGPIPGFRDLVTPIYDTLAGKRAFDFQISPIQSAGQSLVNVAKDVRRVADGDDTKHATKDVLQAAGYTTGLVPGQIATSSQFLVDLGYGEQNPETVADWYRGLTTGKAEPKK